MGLVDFHTHFFSRTFFDALTDLSPRAGSRGDKLAPVLQKTGIELPPEDTGEHTRHWLAELDRHEIEHAVSFASVPEEIPVLAEAARIAQGRLSPMAIAKLVAPGAADKVRTLVTDAGFKGLLTFPAMHHYTVSDEAARTALEALAEVRGILYVHCGMLVVKLRDLLGIPRAYDMRYANPLDVLPAANAFPDVRFVIPHFGAGYFRETLMLGAQADNVYVDTSSTNGWIKTQPAALTLRDVFARTLEVFGPERLLFGTDSGLFPAGWRRERLDEQRAILEELGVSSAEATAVFGGNANNLLARA